MKKLISAIVICVLLLGSVSFLPASAEEGDFVIKDGVLLSYSGSSSEVTVPSTVRSVGDYAFAKNAHITSVTIPDSVDSIGSRAFYDCTALKTVRGGANVASVGVYAFNGTQFFEKSTDEFLTVGKTLIWYNGDLPYITLPSSCLSIAPYAFLRCGTAKMIRASSELISVGAGAFYECSNLESVILPDSVTYVGAYAFDGTPYLETLGEFATVGDGILVSYGGSDPDVAVPDGIRRVASHTFRSSKLRSVTLPSSVYSVDPYAFADCVGLEDISFGDGLTVIGDGAFRGCRALKKLTTPRSLVYIGQHAFNSTSLEDIRLYGNGLTVSDNAFKNCNSLRCVLIPEGAAALYDDAFSGCSGLEGISVPASVTDVSSSALSGCDKAVVTCTASCAAASALAAHKVNNVIGDSDGDGELSILDATTIQYIAAQLVSLDGACTAASDFDFNGVIDVIDAADVQLTLAELI